jgi:hypothetical protein
MITLRVLVACVAICMLPGCGKSGARRHLASGAVSVAGVPAATGVIRFDPVDPGDLPGGGVIVAGRYEAWLTPGPKVVRLAVEGDRTGLKPTDLSPNIVPRKFLDDPPRVEIPSKGDLDFHLTAGASK